MNYSGVKAASARTSRIQPTRASTSSGSPMPDDRRRGRLLVAVVFTALMVWVSWPSIWADLYGRPMEDRRVYASQIANHYLSYDLQSFDSLSSYISDEFLWGWILNLLIRVAGMPVDLVFGLISASVVFTAALVVTKHEHPAYTLLLVNPLFVDLAFSQMRIALAISFATWAYLVPGKRTSSWLLRVGLLVAASLTHTSALVFIGIFGCSLLISRGRLRAKPLGSYVVLAGVGVLGALLFGPWRGLFLLELQDRRVGVEYDTSSWKFYVIWLILACVLTLDWGSAEPSVGRAYTLSILFTILVGIALGVYVNRVITVSLPFLLLGIQDLSGRWRDYVVIAYMGYATLHWAYWLHLMS